jgi:hypothetical protein
MEAAASNAAAAAVLVKDHPARQCPDVTTRKRSR